MELNAGDKEVIELLSKLKNSNGTYPPDILAARRQAYLRQMANIGLGIGIGAGIKNAATQSGNGAGGAAATITSKILETALIAAIVIEAGAAAYIYRDKIADLVRTYTGSPNVQETASPSADTEWVKITEAPSVTVTITPSGTVTITPGTPSPETAGGNNNDTNVSANVTPTPDNNGNQYGLTPKPIRTKDNNDGNKDEKINDGDSGNNNNTRNNNKP